MYVNHFSSHSKSGRWENVFYHSCHSVNDKKVMQREGSEWEAQNAISPVTGKAEGENFCPGTARREKISLFYLFGKGGGGLGNIQRSICKLMVSGCGRVAVTVASAERDGNSISHPSRKKPLYTHVRTYVREHARTYTRPWASKEDPHTHSHTYICVYCT